MSNDSEVRTHRVEGGWVVADAGGWLPGVFATEAEARTAGGAATLTLTDFLLARIAEDEAYWRHGEGRNARDCQECASLSDHEPTRPTVDRMLAEAQAKRQIVARHNSDGWDFACEVEGGGRPDPADCPDLRNLAAIYANHPHYHEGWRP